MLFRQLFEADTCTYTYLLADGGEAVLIDPVRETLERDLGLLEELGLQLVYTLETHVHADHVTAGGELRERVGSRSVVSATGGAPCADMQVREGDVIRFGSRSLEVLETPGHTNGCVSYLLDDRSMVFTGDAMLIRKTGRTDFQQGDPVALYRSITTKLFALPDETRVYPGHDYRGFTVSTIGEEKAHNSRVGGGRSEAEFVEIMKDLRLAQPKRIAEAVPANLSCGLFADGEEREPGWAPVVRSSEGVPEIAGSWVAEHLDVKLVDVREPDEWKEGHIDGAELVPMATVGSRAGEWSRSEPIVVVCRSGQRSAQVARQLEDAGFARVASLRGGVLGWAKDGRKLVR